MYFGFILTYYTHLSFCGQLHTQVWAYLHKHKIKQNGLRKLWYCYLFTLRVKPFVFGWHYFHIPNVMFYFSCLFHPFCLFLSFFIIHRNELQSSRDNINGTRVELTVPVRWVLNSKKIKVSKTRSFIIKRMQPTNYELGATI